ncbi:MAG: hypothetical protein JXA42_20565 [Anaerolineales bacterium]|nr:hypothetical protein [Anaerolineales bacterium]
MYALFAMVLPLAALITGRGWGMDGEQLFANLPTAKQSNKSIIYSREEKSMAEPQLKIGKIENAPDWVGKSLDELDFEWSKEEELMLERYCEKIIKNSEEEDMTPMERYQATWDKKDKDRLHIEVKYNVPYAVRTLDSWADAIKPGDMYKWPKLHVMCHLATAARFKLDIINVYVIYYTEGLWGGDARLIDYGTPQLVGDPPIKTMEDLEAVAVPDPKKHGLYPGYLWTLKELRRVMKKYGADKVLPVEYSFCGDPLGNVFLAMTGFAEGVVMVAKQPELFRACMEKMTEWTIKFGHAVKETDPDGMYICTFMGAFPPKMGKKVDNTFIMDLMAKIGREMAAGEENPRLWHTGGANGWEQWMELYYDRGAMGPGSFNGWWIGPELDYNRVFEYFREKDLYCGCSIDDHIVLDGDLEAMEAQLAPRLKIAKQYPKHCCCLGVIDYWTPQPVFEELMNMAKRLGRF